MLKFAFSFGFLFLAYCLHGQSSLNVELRDNWRDESLASNSSGVRYNDCWGFVWEGNEYAVAGSTEGTHFFQITDEDHLVEVDSVTARHASAGVIHRDFKSYRNYVYGVCDEGISSLQIIDISALPVSVNKVADLGSNFGRVHNLFIDTSRALLFACGVTHESGGVLQDTYSMEVYSLLDPVNPSLLYTGPNDIPIVHDAFARGNLLYLNCGFDGLRVYDFTDVSNPIYKQNLDLYQDQGYNHQGWMTPDGQVYVFGDETAGKRLKKCTVGGNGTLSIQSLFGTNFDNGSVPHNIMCTNEFAFVAYYNEGLRIFDLRRLPVTEVAHYDTYPQSSAFNMNGAWGIYANLPSGRLLVSDRQNGLFLLDFPREIFSLNQNEFTLYPNPLATGDILTLRAESEVSDFWVRIYDLNGRLVHTETFNAQNYAQLRLHLAAGTYQLNLHYIDYLGDEQIERKKFVVQ